MPRIAAILAVLIGASLSQIARGEPIRLALDLVEGQTLAYRVEQSFDIQTSIDDEEGQLAEMRHHTDLRLTVRQLQSDGGATLALNLDRVSIETRAFGETREFDWARSAQDASDTPRTTDADRAGMILVKSAISVVIDASGRVTAISGLEPFADEAMSMGESGALFVGLFARERLATALESVFRPDGSARNAFREAGERWTVTRTRPMPTIGNAESTTAWTLTEVNADTATLKGDTVMSVRQRDDQLTTVPRVKVIDQESATVVRWDTRSDQLIESETERSLTSQWSLADQALIQAQSVELKIKRLDRPDDPAP